MYRTRVVHPLSQGAPLFSDAQIEVLWSLFDAVGDHWALGDTSANYRLRWLSFMANRVDLDPLYLEYYRDGAQLITAMVTEIGQPATFDKIFSKKPRISPSGLPTTPLEILQRFVANEFIALRLSLGSFKAFGALNYPGYFGGANIEGEPIPYRTRKDQ